MHKDEREITVQVQEKAAVELVKFLYSSVWNRSTDTFSEHTLKINEHLGKGLYDMAQESLDNLKDSLREYIEFVDYFKDVVDEQLYIHMSSSPQLRVEKDRVYNSAELNELHAQSTKKIRERKKKISKKVSKKNKS